MKVWFFKMFPVKLKPEQQQNLTEIEGLQKEQTIPHLINWNQ